MKYLVALCAVLASGSAFAVSTLTIGDDIKVTAINGQAINQSPFQPHKRQFELDAGRHVITARYDRLFEIGRKDHDYLKSGDITLTVELEDNQGYQLVLDNAPQDYNTAKDYVKSPTLLLMQGKVMVAKQAGTPTRGGLFSSLGGIFGKDSTASNQQAIASLNQQAPAPVQAPASKANASTLDKFMELWLNASEEERQKIRQWVQE